MELGLSQRVALVTGASSGLGLAIARTLAAEGCAVAMAARGGELLEREAADIVAQAKGRALPLRGDVTRVEDVARITSQAASMLGPTDILLANAGEPPSTMFATTIANECAPDDLFVNTVLPGHFDTHGALEPAKLR